MTEKGQVATGIFVRIGWADASKHVSIHVHACKYCTYGKVFVVPAPSAGRALSAESS